MLPGDSWKRRRLGQDEGYRLTEVATRIVLQLLLQHHKAAQPQQPEW